MAEDMSAERPVPVPREEQVANRWMRMKGVQKPEEPKPVNGGGLFGRVTEAFRKPAETPTLENPNQLVGEAYDLFVEKQALQDDITRKQREVMEPKPTTPALTLDQKRELIRQGRIGAILQSVSSAEPFGEVVAKSQARTKEVDTRLDEIFTTPGMYEKFHEDLSRQVRVRHQAREVRSLDKFSEQADVLAVKLTREAQVQGRALTSVERQFVEDNQALKVDAIQRRQELLKNPEVFDRVRIMDLQEYQRQMQKDRFAETPSRRIYLRKIEAYWAEAKKVLLTGETGTGKTEMIKHASNVLFGVNPEPVTGHQDMSIYELLGKTGFRVQEGDVFRPAPLVRAMTGRDGKGQPFLFDEIDRAPNQSVMGIKTILNARPGEKGVRVQTDSAGSFNVGPDYAVAATANIKSEKYATATELDPAIVRVFDAPMDIDYIPAPEVYDLALATLMDKRGGIPLGEGDARVVLKNLCDAASWIQDAYQGRQVVTDPASGTTLEARGQAATGKAASLKKALLDPGRTLDMLNGWSAAQIKGTTFEDYLNQRVTEFINNRAYPDEDRYYLTEIFALKGFLKGRKASDLMVSGLTQDTLDRWSGATSTRTAKTPGNVYLTADKVARLDPYRRFKRPASADAEDLLADDEVDEPFVETTGSGRPTGRMAELKSLVGDITRQDTTLAAHAGYIDRLEQIASQTTSSAEKKQAIELLEEYAQNGAYKEMDFRNSSAPNFLKALPDKALEKAGELRKAAIEQTSNFDTISQFAGKIDERGSIIAHNAYIERLHQIAASAPNRSVILKAVGMLEEYAKSGAFSDMDYRNSSAPNFLKSLTQKSQEFADELRQKMMSSL